jgi:hypothetical protein
LVLDDEVSGNKPRFRLEQPSQQRGGDREGWVGDNPVGTAGKAKVGCVGLDDDDRAAEALAQDGRSVRVSLYSDNSCSSIQQRTGEFAGAGADIDDEGARCDSCLSDEQFGPARR